jgi:hypothetical protein
MYRFQVALVQKRRDDGERERRLIVARVFAHPFPSAMALKALDQRMAAGPSSPTNGPATSSNAGRQHQATPHSRSNSVLDPKASDGGKDAAH